MLLPRKHRACLRNKIAHERKIPVTPRGAGTASPAARPGLGGIVMSFEKMNRILELDEKTHDHRRARRRDGEIAARRRSTACSTPETPAAATPPSSEATSPKTPAATKS
ncbi:MAG: FAD-binding protein [Cloacibacillus evryensis]